MGMLKRIRGGWKAMTPVEKFKLITRLVIGFGTGWMSSSAADELTKGAPKPVKACSVVASWGIGMAVGNAAGNAMDEFVDNCVELHQMRKEEKAREAGKETANA